MSWRYWRSSFYDDIFKNLIINFHILKASFLRIPLTTYIFYTYSILRVFCHSQGIYSFRIRPIICKVKVLHGENQDSLLHLFHDVFLIQQGICSIFPSKFLFPISCIQVFEMFLGLKYCNYRDYNLKTWKVWIINITLSTRYLSWSVISQVFRVSSDTLYRVIPYSSM